MPNAPVKKVLVVDDEKIIRDFLAKFFAVEGIEATCVEGGFEAIKIAQTAHFDMIFLDVRMPKMDGVETLKALKKITGNNTRFIMMTGYSIDDLLKKLDTEKIEAFIKKPFEMDELQNILEDYSKQKYREEFINILIIENEPAMSDLFLKLLKGYNLTFVKNGKDALSQVALKDFDLVISDLLLNDMSGLEAYTKIKALKPDLDIILIMGDTKNKSHIIKGCLFKQINDLFI
jgi:CheY-like chemotaxis protein